MPTLSRSSHAASRLRQSGHFIIPNDGLALDLWDWRLLRLVRLVYAVSSVIGFRKLSWKSVDDMPDPSRWLNANIAGWRALEGSEKKAIRDFAILWSFFELNATWQYGRPNANPRNIARAVDDLPQDPDITRLEPARNHFAARYIDGDHFTHHWGYLRLDEQYVERTRLGLAGAARTSRDTFLALLLIANRLRNNFFHGEKAQFNFAGQLNNFTHANALLIYALELWHNPQEGLA